MSSAKWRSFGLGLNVLNNNAAIVFNTNQVLRIINPFGAKTRTYLAELG